MRNLKKVISSVAALAIVASSASAFAVSFPDVETSASYANAVGALTALGVINGDDNGLFNPDNQVTRAEFTKMAVEALGEGDAATSQTTSQFTDAANTTVHWAAGYISQGVSDGFINGYDDTTFGPDDQVTYAQACKMLVAAIGYTTYAENQGGWPAGYVAQASTLGITSGVSATNDTNLTRAQVATLIYNAMGVPLCVIKEWESNVNYATGEIISTPVLEKLDGKSNRDYQTLLTDRHDAYKVKGRVKANAKSSSELKADEVRYQVELADNFDDDLDVKKDTYDGPFVMKVGETNAADMLFEYSEALIQKDEDSDEYTILSISQYGSSKVVDVAADDVSDDDTTTEKFAVFKDGTSNKTTKYDLAPDVEVYVNGVQIKPSANETILDIFDAYIYDNAAGTVKLIDSTQPGSTTTDGKYDYIMVSYYVDAVVDSVQTTSSAVKIYFKDGGDVAANKIKASMSWDPESEDTDITFTKDDKVIDYTDLEEYDVLSIAYDVTEPDGKSIDDLRFYDIKVASNSVTGVVTRHVSDEYDNCVTIDGSEYDFIGAYDAVETCALNTEYTLYINAFGYVAFAEEGTSNKNYGVVVGFSNTNSAYDKAVVRLITSDAEVVSYECSKEADELYFYKAFTGDTTATAVPANKNFKKAEYADRIKKGLTTVEYQVSSGKIKEKKTASALKTTGFQTADFKASTSKLGSYTVAEGVTKLIDIEDYIAGSDATVGTMAVSSLIDENEYKFVLFDQNNNSEYKFGIVSGGAASLRDDMALAIVQKSNGTTDVDGTTCNEYVLAVNGQEGVSVLFDESIELNEGDVISYMVGKDGYVDNKIAYVYSVAASYDDMMAEATATGLFAEKSGKFAKFTPVDGKKVQATTAVGYTSISTTKPSYIYYGPVYKKVNNTLELFVTGDSGKVNVNQVESLSVAGANQYVYDFSARSKNHVTVGAQSQNTSLFPKSVYTDDTKSVISWANVVAEGAQPAFVLVKEVDREITDVIYFIAE